MESLWSDAVARHGKLATPDQGNLSCFFRVHVGHTHAHTPHAHPYTRGCVLNSCFKLERELNPMERGYVF